jgi:ribosomal protein L16 Arg81 hydroxylase
MKPGSVMYLPRGWWHSTHTSEPSVHLDLLGALPTWADAARVQLEAALRDEVWRSPMVRPDERMGALLLETLSRRFRRSSR